jgi:hypothetical protein
MRVYLFFSLFKKAYKSYSNFAKIVMAICTHFNHNVVNISDITGKVFGMSIGNLTPSIVTHPIDMRFDIPIHHKNT